MTAERADFDAFAPAAVAERVDAARQRLLEVLNQIEAPTKTDGDCYTIAILDLAVARLAARAAEAPALRDTFINLLMDYALRLARVPDASQAPQETLQ